MSKGTKVATRPFNGTIVTKLLKRMEVTQFTLGVALGVGTRTIKRWELGQTTPHPGTVLGMAAFFGVGEKVFFQKTPRLPKVA